jgi:hypothetical protein
VRLLPRLPDTVSNPLSLLGMAITSAMAILFIVLTLLHLAGFLTNPYIGLLVFVAVPTLFLLGLLLIPVGGRLSARRRRLHPDAEAWPVIDLRQPRQRTVLVAVIALTLVNIVIVSLAAYGGVHYMESTEFCGQVCHTTMEPEYVAHQAWPHARVSCTQCHVGPGAGAFVEAKLAGTRQLFQVMTNRAPKPVPPPPHLIRTARETCEGCHSPEIFRGDRERVIREYADDEANTETVTRLRLHVGGGSARLGVGTGIHWHMNLDNRIEFAPAGGDEDAIPYVRLTDRQGTVREYFAEGVTASQLAGRPLQQMDCMDCHNRPAHTFFFTPQRAVDSAIAEGRLPRELPFVRREALAAVTATYVDRTAALAAIAARLRGFYTSRGDIEPALVRRAVTATQDVWSTNLFPAMSVAWGTYPNHIGHVDSPGCFRCHDDSKKSADGKVISQDCELCHTLPE